MRSSTAVTARYAPSPPGGKVISDITTAARTIEQRAEKRRYREQHAEIIAALDGSVLSNPGPAGWAWHIDIDHWRAAAGRTGTNNMG